MGNGKRKKRGHILKQSKIAANGQKNGRRKESNSEGVTAWVTKALEMMKEGLSQQYITNFISENKKGGHSTGTIKQILGNASQIINNEYTRKISEVQLLHVRRYNENIVRLLKTTCYTYDDVANQVCDWEQFFESKNRKIKAFNDAINSIVQKENTLQMDSNTFTVEVNEEMEVNIKEEKAVVPVFNVSKLTFVEQVELYELMRKAKQGEADLASVIEGVQEATGQITEDVKAIVDTPANVASIKHEKLEVIEEKPPFVVDPTAKLKETLRRLAAARIKEIGGHLDPQEKAYLEVKK